MWKALGVWGWRRRARQWARECVRISYIFRLIFESAYFCLNSSAQHQAPRHLCLSVWMLFSRNFYASVEFVHGVDYYWRNKPCTISKSTYEFDLENVRKTMDVSGECNAITNVGKISIQCKHTHATQTHIKHNKAEPNAKHDMTQ